MYQLLKKILFTLDPERSHDLALQGLSLINKFGLSRFYSTIPENPRTVFGLTFPNPIGLAAGLDKNADYVDALASLGFGFIEIGTVTPKPQAGNPKPRLFRLVEHQAIINRMGFNNKGVEHVVKRLEKIRYRGILGINIGKNKDTPLDQAVSDYLFCFRQLWKYASYIAINVSSPNTAELRTLQQRDLLTDLLFKLKAEQKNIVDQYKKYVPLVVKISPDLSSQELNELANVILDQQIDGIIATNTTIHRDGVEDSPYAKENGGLSGKPLQARNTKIIKELYSIVQNNIPIIAVGGVMDESSAQEKFASGATLIQLYTGFIFEGAGLIKRLAKQVNYFSA